MERRKRKTAFFPLFMFLLPFVSLNSVLTHHLRITGSLQCILRGVPLFLSFDKYGPAHPFSVSAWPRPPRLWGPMFPSANWRGPAAFQLFDSPRCTAWPIGKMLMHRQSPSTGLSNSGLRDTSVHLQTSHWKRKSNLCAYTWLLIWPWD